MVRNNHFSKERYQLEHKHVPLVNCMELQLRFLSPQDIDQVKCLCRDWFPIDYPDTWYQEITSNPRFFSLAATLSGSIIGLIVAETKELSIWQKRTGLYWPTVSYLTQRLATFYLWVCHKHIENKE